MLRTEIRDAWRALTGTPAYTATVTLMLALGIGVNTAVFSVLDAVLFRSLPYADAGRIVLVAERPRGGGNWTAAPVAFAHWRETARSFSQLEARVTQTFALLEGGDPEAVRGARVTPGYFDLLGVRAAEGRTFQAADAAAGRGCAAIISYRLWASRLGGDRARVGQPLRLGGTTCTLVGVLPAESVFDRGAPELYVPLAFSPAEAQSQGRFLTVLGRLRSDVTIDQARAEMETLAAAFNPTRGAAGANWSVNVLPWRDVLIRTDAKQLAWVLTAAVGLVLLIACANVAGLSLSRTIGRRRELAVRAALGAGRARLFRALLVESLMLALIGGLAGVVVGQWALRAFVALVPPNTFPPEAAASLDSRTLVFTAAVAILTGMLAGTLPAWQAGRMTLTEALGGSRGAAGSRQSTRLQSALLVVELALAMVLVTGASLLAVSFVKLAGVSPGFDSAGVVTLQLSVPPGRYTVEPDWAAFYARTLDAIRAVPGVERAGAVTSLPLGGWLFGTRFAVEGVPSDPARPSSAHIQHATDGYLEALRIPLAAGRSFRSTDDASAPPVAIVNETLVRRFIPDGHAVGRRLRLGDDAVVTEIVGVVGDVKTGGLADAALATPEIYVPHQQAPMPAMFLAIRTTFDEPTRVLPQVRAALRAVDAEVPVSGAMSMADRLGASLRTRRFRTMLIGAFATVAAMLACLGVYAVRSRAVAARLREMGIRLALGATRAQVVALALRQGARLTAAGLGVGLLASFFFTRAIDQWLFDTRATDPSIIAAAIALLGAAAALASYIPARRAAQVDPAAALRDQ
jgi:predicted permease